MRLWTIHARYLDAKGLAAAWREALLAQAVLRGHTQGYRHHPQLRRFRVQACPIAAVGAFLRGLASEAQQRGYRFDLSKITRSRFHGQVDETEGQLLYEWQHLLAKLRRRSPRLYRQFKGIARPQVHPLFRIVPGGVRDWEKQPAARARRTVLNRRPTTGKAAA